MDPADHMPESRAASFDHVVEEQVRIPCDGRDLCGSLAYPDRGEAHTWVLLAGPHPLLGGDLANNVVRAIQVALAGAGAITLSWNYGGVGGSDGGPEDWEAVTSAFWESGTFEEERGWVAEARHVQAYLRRQCDGPLVLIGYSFGCRVMMEGAAVDEANAFALISPNPNTVDFGKLAATAAPLLVVHSTNDFTCSVEALETWYTTLREPKTRILIDAGEHFFRGREDEVARSVLSFVDAIGYS